MNDDNKIVSISFDNRQFMENVSDTMDALDRLNDSTSGKNLKSDGIDNLNKSFDNLNKSATTNIDGINNALRDNTSYIAMSDSIGNVSSRFSALETIATGVLLGIGGLVARTAADITNKLAGALTSGIRDGWSEYNMLIDSTQTILANTERFGTNIDDVTAALDNLNTYADKTIYRFSDMTRNIGYFTTAGQDLESSVMAIRGMANMGAFFGATSEQVSRATYQISQAMQSGKIRLQDWMSLERNSMAGRALQEELLRTAAIMSGRSYDAMVEYIGGIDNFRDSLRDGWLTADIFTETMRKFAGESREYWESLTDAQGNRLYDDEEINRIIRLGESAEESATKVRTFRMMIDSLKEAVGSGWAQTFRILIGDLEQAKEFWTPINDMLTSIIGSISTYRNSILSTWADIYRNIAVDDILVALRAIYDVFVAIGNGISRAFGSTDSIAERIGKITEAIGDFAYTLRLDEEELSNISDLVEGLLSPFSLLGDIVYELSIALFNSTARFGDFTQSGNSLLDMLTPIRKGFISFLGTIGRLLTRGVEIIRQLGIIPKAVEILRLGIIGLVNALRDIAPVDKFRDVMASIMSLFSTSNDPSITFTDKLVNLKNSVVSLLSELGSNLKILFTGIWQTLNLNESTLVKTFRESRVVQIVMSFVNGIKQGLETVFEHIPPFSFFAHKVGDEEEEAANELADKTDKSFNIIQFAFDKAKAIIDAIKNFVASLFGRNEDGTYDTETAMANISKLVKGVIATVAAIAAIAVQFKTASLERSLGEAFKTGFGFSKALSDSIGFAAALKYGMEKFSLAISEFGKAAKISAKRFGKAAIISAYSDFFKTFAIFMAVLIAGVYLLSGYDFNTIAKVFGLIIGSMAVIVGLIVLCINLVSTKLQVACDSAKGFGANVARFAYLTKVFGFIAKVLTGLMIFIFAISLVAMNVANKTPGQRESFIVSMAVIGGILAIMLVSVGALLLIVSKLSKGLSTVNTALDIQGKASKKIMLSLPEILHTSLAFTLIGAAISGLILAIAQSIALVLALKPDADLVIKVGVVLTAITLLLTTITTGLLLLSSKMVVTDESVKVVKKITKSMLSFIPILLAVGVTMALILSAVGKLANSLSGIRSREVEVLKSIIFKIGLTIVGIFAALGVMAFLAKRNAINTGEMLVAAMAFTIASGTLIGLSIGIAFLANALYNVEDSKINTAVSAITNTFIILVSTLSVVAILAAKMKGFSLGVLTATASLILIASSLVIMAKAFKELSGIYNLSSTVKPIKELMIALGIIVGGLAFLVSIAGGWGAAGIAIAAGALIAVAGAIYIISSAMYRASDGMAKFADAIDKLAESLTRLQSVDISRVKNVLQGFFEVIPTVIHNNADSIKDAVVDVFEIITTGALAGLETAFNIIKQFLIQHGLLKGDVLRGIFKGILTSLLNYMHDTLVALNEFLRVECGENGVLRDTIDVLGDFIVWAGGYLATFSIDLVDSVINGLVTALQEHQVAARIAHGLYSLYVGARMLFFDATGVMSWTQLGELAAINLMDGFLQKIGSVFDNIRDIIPDIEDLWPDAPDAVVTAYDSAFGMLSTVGSIMDDVRSSLGMRPKSGGGGSHLNGTHAGSAGSWFDQRREEIMAESSNSMMAMLNEWGAAEDALNDLMKTQEEIRESMTFDPARNYNTSGSMYDPSQYYAAAAGVEDWSNEFEKTPGIWDRVMDVLSQRTSLSEALGLDDITNTFEESTDSFTEAGGNSGSSWWTGFADSISNAANSSDGVSALTDMTNMDFSNVEELKNVDWSNFNLGLDNASITLNDISNPVITPWIDDKEYNLGLDKMEATWNSHKFDEFAIDAGKTMTLREAGESGAESNGNITYNYTQINNSPKELSPIEIYRDTKNLIRGRINA